MLPRVHAGTWLPPCGPSPTLLYECRGLILNNSRPAGCSAAKCSADGMFRESMLRGSNLSRVDVPLIECSMDQCSADLMFRGSVFRGITVPRVNVSWIKCSAIEGSAD